MAKATSNRACMFLYMAMLLSLLLVIDMTQGGRNSQTGGIGVPKKNSVVECNSVTSVVSGDTCISIAKEFSLTTKSFDLINPNIVCTKLFVGQWLCVDGVAS